MTVGIWTPCHVVVEDTKGGGESAVSFLKRVRGDQEPEDDWEFVVSVQESGGEYVAVCPAMPSVPPQRAATEDEAVAGLARAIANALGKSEDQPAVAC